MNIQPNSTPKQTKPSNLNTPTALGQTAIQESLKRPQPILFGPLLTRKEETLSKDQIYRSLRLRGQKRFVKPSVKFNDSSDLPTGGEKRILTSALKRAQSLVTMPINFSNDDGKHLEDLLRSFKHLNPSALCLSFLWGNAHIYVQNLSWSLKSLPSLSILKLSFEGCKGYQDLDISGLFMSLKYVLNLTSLSLVFKMNYYGPPITDDCIKESGFKPQKHSPHSQNLHWTLGHCSEITNKGVKTLSLSLMNLASLTCLAINLGGRKYLSGQSAKSLCLALKSLPLLSELSLNLFRMFSDKKLQ